MATPHNPFQSPTGQKRKCVDQAVPAKTGNNSLIEPRSRRRFHIHSCHLTLEGTQPRRQAPPPLLDIITHPETPYLKPWGVRSRGDSPLSRGIQQALREIEHSPIPQMLLPEKIPVWIPLQKKGSPSQYQLINPSSCNKQSPYHPQILLVSWAKSK